jgi:hypothetical protein
VDEHLCRAIRERRLVAFTHKGCARVGEPHDFGVASGEKKLFYYQVGGTSRSAGPLTWRWAKLAEMSDLRILDQHFPGPRPAPSGRHQRWDRLIASVSRKVDPDGVTRS